MQLWHLNCAAGWGLSECIQMGRIQSNRPVEKKKSLRASSPWCSGSKAGKGRRACNYVSGIWISASKKSMWNADWRRWCYFSNDVNTLRMCFALIGGNLTAQPTGSHRGIGGEIQIPDRHSCKLSFLFPPHCPSAPESLPAGWRTTQNFISLKRILVSNLAIKDEEEWWLY